MKNKKVKELIAKLLRILRITKPIPLTPQEVKWIKLCKLHYKNDKQYKYIGHEWTDVLKPMFNEIYGWDADEHYNDFLECIFFKLLEIHLKIKLDYSGYERQLESIFKASFYKGISREQERPIERAISELCSIIQNNQVIVNGVHRYYL